MSLIVQKFGGSSVANAERVFNVADIITSTYKAGNQVIVVVSAQGDTTDDLIEKAKEINPSPSKREMDMLLSTGEQISISLLAMAIEKLGFPVVSLTGWQVGVHTNSNYSNARIRKINQERIQKELDKNNIVIVAGFQGINRYDDITTLGRGGSDTSAVALAAALHADLCEIYTDVDGVYTTDPRIVPEASKLDEITFDDLSSYIEIAHADPYVPSMPFAKVVKEELPDNIERRIFIYERASQFDLLSENPSTFMWVSPAPKKVLERYNLVQKKCIDNQKLYKDVLIYKDGYKLTNLDKQFITELCDSKRKYL